ncbi:MAG: transposase [Leptolinea sp.]|jgi:putative transposase|nr:transposase [Leptolinea sp.]
MPEYRRSWIPGGTYFFTIVTFNREHLFSDKTACRLLIDTWKDVQSRHPFTNIAACILPDHIHAIWTLPEDDDSYPIRWKEIKRLFTKEYTRNHQDGIVRTRSQQLQGEATIWHRRYWEHTIRDQDDLNAHIDYVHINPLKHGLVSMVKDWPWSSFHRYVKMGIYPEDWGGKAEIKLMGVSRGE